MSRYAPSGLRIREYLSKKKCQDIEKFLLDIRYDEELMISLWMRTFITLGKWKKEIEMKLLKKGFSRELARAKIEENIGEIEDWESQRSFILHQIDTLIHRGKSRRMISVILIQKYSYFRDEIDNILSELDDTDSLKKEVQKYKNRYNLENPKDREKIIAALLRKGFSYSEIKKELF